MHTGKGDAVTDQDQDRVLRKMGQTIEALEAGMGCQLC